MYEDIAPTAKIVSYLRTLADTPYTQNIADMCAAQEVFRSSFANPDEFLWLAVFFEVRYRLINQAIQSSGIKNVFEFASGLSPRGLELTENPEITYMESDLPKVINEKEKIVRAILEKTRRPNLKFASVNVFDHEAVREASRKFVNLSVAFVCEGLLIYLSLAEKRKFAGIVRVLLEKHPGSIFATTDIWSKKGDETFVIDENVRRSIETFSKVSGRNMLENFFESYADAQKLFEDAGLVVERSAYLEESQLMSLYALREDEQERAKRIVSGREVWVLSPK